LSLKVEWKEVAASPTIIFYARTGLAATRVPCAMKMVLDAHQRSHEPMSASAGIFSQSFFHGTRADLKPGDLIVVGHRSNFTGAKPLSWVYFAATLDAAIWGAELAAGSGKERIYVVEPSGPIMDDPNLTDKKFPGNPTLSYRSRDPLRIIAEVTNWQAHPPERLQQMKDGLARMKSDGSDIID
jgi:rifampin ADP-ribosyltransferase